jgi:hypothetical protein
MSTKTIMGIIAAVVVIGGGAWYFSSKGTDTGMMASNGEEKKESNEGSGTFADLVGRAGSWQCHVKTNVENAPSEGTSYVAGGKVSADFTSTVAGKNITSHMISSDGYVYTWSDAYPQGMKMKQPEGANPYTANVEYSCEGWAEDASKFVPPASVSFIEFGSTGMPQGVPGGYPTPN